MKLRPGLLLIINLCAISSVLQAELLVVKRINKHFGPLDASDESNKVALSTIFLNYEWPTVIANSSLTSAERDALLTAGRPNAEEDFIRTRVKLVNPSYDIIFIPTSIYELFVMAKYAESAVNQLKLAAQESKKKLLANVILQKALGSRPGSPPKPEDTPQSVYKQVFNEFGPSNEIF